VEPPETGYARVGDLHVAFETLGSGPIDLLGITNGTTISVDRDDEPHWVRFDRRLASFSRLIRFDPRGLGLSDPLPHGVVPTLETWTEDALAVLDAVGSRTAVTFGVGNGGNVSMLLSARHPSRISKQIIMHAAARLVWAADYPLGFPQELVDRFVNSIADVEPGHEDIGELRSMAPSMVDDVAFKSWWKLAGQRGASPAIARAIHVIGATSDLRSLLPKISTPTLVLHRTGNRFVPLGHSQYLATHLRDARLVELPGSDHLAFVGDTALLAEEIEEFLTGSRGAHSSDRVLSTVLVTDIVDSTRKAEELGDGRWHELLDDHDRMADKVIHHHDGRRVKLTGDGIIALFQLPARAIQCGLELCRGAEELGLGIRVGIHSGEVEIRGDDVAGIGVHIASRVQSEARPGMVLVSKTVTDLVTGSGIKFEDLGPHDLKGVEGSWQLLEVID
jgi:class 3 adenylate cyclase